MTIVIHIDPEPLLDVLDIRGWNKGSFAAEDGTVCLHGAVRLCSPQPGDAHLIEQVARRQGWGTSWNDAPDRTEQDVRDLLGRGIDITDEDLADAFGLQWRAVVNLVRRAAVLTEDEARALRAAHSAAYSAAYDAAYDAAYAAYAAYAAADIAAAYAIRAAARAVATWHLATDDGPYTIAQRDLLIAPWVQVCGLPEGLVEG